MRGIFCFIAICVSLISLIQNSFASERSEQFRQSAVKILSVLKKGDVTASAAKLNEMKVAGLSYQGSITLPLTDGFYACKPPEDLRAVRGMLIFDSYYAALFGKKKELLDVGRQFNELSGKLNLPASFKPENFRKLLDDPHKGISQDKIFAEIQKYIDEMIEQSSKDPKTMLALLESLHGFNLEALYIYTTLALTDNSRDKNRNLFSFPLERITLYDNALKSISPKDKELLAMLERDQRQALYTPIITVLKQRKGILSKTDIQNIIFIIKPERDRLLQKCN